MVNITRMYMTQKKFDERVSKGKTISQDKLTLAINVEMHEMINAIGVWKWWKKSATLDKEKILDELADVMAFWLCTLDNIGNDSTAEYFTSLFIKDLDKFNPIPVEELQPFNGRINYEFVLNMIRCYKCCQYYLDITPEDLQEAYLKKMNINNERQDNNY